MQELLFYEIVCIVFHLRVKIGDYHQKITSSEIFRELNNQKKVEQIMMIYKKHHELSNCLKKIIKLSRNFLFKMFLQYSSKSSRSNIVYKFLRNNSRTTVRRNIEPIELVFFLDCSVFTINFYFQ